MSDISELGMRIIDRIEKAVRVDIPSENYLSKLDPKDQRNIRTIVEGLRNTENLVGGNLVAIGSSVRKRKDWNDLDLRIFAERGCPIPLIIERFQTNVEKSALFNITKGKVPTERGETRDCFYLEPKTGGKIIHVILPSPELDAPADDELWLNRLFRKKYSFICRF